MTRSTSPIALAALCLGLLVPATATYGQAVSAAAQPRTCRGDLLTLFWGTVVRDQNGPCRRAEAPRREPAARPTPPSATVTCPSKRSYLGGALQICADQPRARAHR